MISLALLTLLAADGAGYFPLPKQLKVKPEALKPKPFDLTIKKPAQAALANGLKVYFVEDHAAPLVTIRALVQLGSYDDPPTRLGLSALLFDVLTSGGAGERNADQLDELLEYQAADLFASPGDEFSSVVLSMRAQDLDKLLPVFADVLMRPRFQGDRFDVAVNKQLESIRRRADRPDGLAMRALYKAVYGPTSLLGRESTALTVKAVKLEELKTTHARVFGPATTALVVTGDFDPKKVQGALGGLLGGWKGGEKPKRDFGPAPKLGRRVILVPKQTPQVKIRIGAPGYARLDPVEYPMRLVSTALGSFGVGRLYKEIRDERGLAYSAYAQASPGPTIGLFMAGFDSKVDTAAQALEVGLPILEGKDAALSKPELVTAADMAVNSFAFRFDSAAKIGWERAVLDLYGYPDDYLEQFRDRIAAVDEKTAQAALERLSNGGNFQIVVVGPEDKLGDLSKFGPVTKISDVEAWK